MLGREKTNRFGADAVFRCKDTMMTDQDLDAVLERGAKKTQEMQSKLNVAEKGDMLDFSFDDGSGVQVNAHIAKGVPATTLLSMGRTLRAFGFHA